MYPKFLIILKKYIYCIRKFTSATQDTLVLLNRWHLGKTQKYLTILIEPMQSRFVK